MRHPFLQANGRCSYTTKFERKISLSVYFVRYNSWSASSLYRVRGPTLFCIEASGEEIAGMLTQPCLVIVEPEHQSIARA